jgi:hypothetical protein
MATPSAPWSSPSWLVVKAMGACMPLLLLLGTLVLLAELLRRLSDELRRECGLSGSHHRNTQNVPNQHKGPSRPSATVGSWIPFCGLGKMLHWWGTYSWA